jgi:hypothetical protein
MPAVSPCDPSESPIDPLIRVATDPVRRARLYDLLGGFCHQCRNHLNSLKLSLYLAGRRGPECERAAWSEHDARYRAVERVYDRLQQICRPMHLTPVRLPVALLWDEVFPAWTELFRPGGIALEPAPPTAPAAVDFDPVRLRPALDALAEWRAATPPSRRVRFAWDTDGGEFLVEWRESVATPAPRAAGSADALALPLLARVLAAHGGTLEIAAASPFHLRLRWPVEVRVHE